MRVVLDANVLISAILSSEGHPAQIVSLWQEGRIELVVSEAVLGELDRVLHYPRIQERYRLPDELVHRFPELLRAGAILVQPDDELTVIDRDPTDNRYLECAVAGHAAYVVSGDDHLLAVGEYRGIRMLAPRDFLVLLKLEGT